MEPEGLPLPLILDGHVQDGNMQRGGWNKLWLEKQVQELGYQEPGEILFLCVNTAGLMLCQGKGKTAVQQKHVKFGQLQEDKQ